MGYQEQLAAATTNQALYEKLLHAFPNLQLQEPSVQMTGNVSQGGSESNPARQILEFVGVGFVALVVFVYVMRRWRR